MHQPPLHRSVHITRDNKLTKEGSFGMPPLSMEIELLNITSVMRHIRCKQQRYILGRKTYGAFMPWLSKPIDATHEMLPLFGVADLSPASRIPYQQAGRPS